MSANTHPDGGPAGVHQPFWIRFPCSFVQHFSRRTGTCRVRSIQPFEQAGTSVTSLVGVGEGLLCVRVQRVDAQRLGTPVRVPAFHPSPPAAAVRRAKLV